MPWCSAALGTGWSWWKQKIAPHYSLCLLSGWIVLESGILKLDIDLNIWSQCCKCMSSSWGRESIGIWANTMWNSFSSRRHQIVSTLTALLLNNLLFRSSQVAQRSIAGAAYHKVLKTGLLLGGCQLIIKFPMEPGVTQETEKLDESLPQRCWAKEQCKSKWIPVSSASPQSMQRNGPFHPRFINCLPDKNLLWTASQRKKLLLATL